MATPRLSPPTQRRIVSCMIRAGVFIGVDRTGHAEPLADAAAGAARMHAWAVDPLGGGLAPDQAVLITDVGGQTVGPDLIAQAVERLLNGPGLDQLIVYFAGHGINTGFNEQWLLSRAPGQAFAAVNVNGSVELAGFCKAQQVVIISDACRVAAEGIQAQRVRGVEIFPNEEPSGRRKPVTQLYACRLGQPASEIRDKKEAAASYQALYTGALLDALLGQVPALLEPGAGAEAGHAFVRLPSLGLHLEAELPRRIRSAGLMLHLNQFPEILPVGAVPPAWLARLPLPRAASAAGPLPPLEDPLALGVRRHVRQAAHGQQRAAMPRSAAASTPRGGAASRPAQTALERWETQADEMARPHGPDHYETGCGLKLRGARVRQATAAHGQCELLGEQRHLVRLHHVPAPGTQVLLELDGGECLLVPAFAGRLSALHFAPGPSGHLEWVDTAFEPSTTAAAVYAAVAPQLAAWRSLRGVAAQAARDGRYHIGPDDVPALMMQLASPWQGPAGTRSALPDPTNLLYAAWSLRELGDDANVQRLHRDTQAALGIGVIDLALLAGSLRASHLAASPPGPGNSHWVLPAVPLLARSWSLLHAHRITWSDDGDTSRSGLLPTLDALRLPSPWTLFEAAAAPLIRSALQQGVLP